MLFANKMIITKEFLHQRFKYQNGFLFYKSKPANRIKIGDMAGYKNGDGYLVVEINHKCYGIHRLIFMMFNGYLPNEIDHIDNNRLNNKIENLRPATKFQNFLNRTKRSDNTSGVKGVYWHKDRKKWQVSLSVNKKSKYFGLFDNFELAKLVSIEARNKYHGNFANYQ
jgi:hypothetical protein